MGKALIEVQIDVKCRFDKTKASRSASSKMPLSLKKQHTVKPSADSLTQFQYNNIGCFFQDCSMIFSESRRKSIKGGHTL